MSFHAKEVQVRKLAENVEKRFGLEMKCATAFDEEREHLSSKTGWKAGGRRYFELYRRIMEGQLC